MLENTVTVIEWKERTQMMEGDLGDNISSYLEHISNEASYVRDTFEWHRHQIFSS